MTANLDRNFAASLGQTVPQPAFDEAQWLDEYVDHCLTALQETCRSLSSQGRHELDGYFIRYNDSDTGISYGFSSFDIHRPGVKENLASGLGYNYGIFYIIEEGRRSFSTFEEAKRRIENGIRALGFTRYHVQVMTCPRIMYQP